MEGEFRLANRVSARLMSDYTAAAGRKFGLTVGGAFAVFSLIAWWREHATALAVFTALALLLSATALITPRQLGPVDRGWMKLAHLISKVTTPIFMGVIYYLVITPFGVVRRRIAGSALVHRPGEHGLWFDRAASPPGSLERLF
jgi:Saxitoxin biosynthesis operon protein SxtJ